MPDPARSYIPVDLRNLRKTDQPFVLTIEDDEEPPCSQLDLFTKHLHISMKMDEGTLDLLFDKIVALRIDLAKKLSFQKGAANALRRKR